MMGVALMVGNDVFSFPGDHSMVLLGTNLLDVGITEGRTCKGNPSWQIVQPFEKKLKRIASARTWQNSYRFCSCDLCHGSASCSKH
jgi:hypothetical protein